MYLNSISPKVLHSAPYIDLEDPLVRSLEHLGCVDGMPAWLYHPFKSRVLFHARLSFVKLTQIDKHSIWLGLH